MQGRCWRINAPSAVLEGTHLHLVGLAVLQGSCTSVELDEIGGRCPDADVTLRIDAEAPLILRCTGYRARVDIVTRAPDACGFPQLRLASPGCS